jgi:hypothetical protein
MHKFWVRKKFVSDGIGKLKIMSKNMLEGKINLTQERDKFFTRTHEKFLETIPTGIKRFLENCSCPKLEY